MIRCTKCSAVLDQGMFNSVEFHPCPICGSLLRADLFPAVYNPLPEGKSGEPLSADDEASCFYHSGKQAVITCSSCGRFLCSLCDIELNNRHLCPSCLESGKKKHRIKDLENHRALYENIVLSMAILPIVIWPFTLVTAPLAIILGIRYWKAPTSIISRRRFRMVLAMILAGMQVAGWSYGLYRLFIYLT